MTVLTILIYLRNLLLTHEYFNIETRRVTIWCFTGIKTHPPGQNEHHLLALDQFN